MTEIKGFQAYIKTFSKSLQNNEENCEDEDDFGIIPDLELENLQFNPAIYFGLYLEFLNPENPRLFQRAQRDAKFFDIHNLTNMCLFEMSPIGVHNLAKMLHKLCKIVNKPGFGNASIRATGNHLLKSVGFEQELVQMFSSVFSKDSSDESVN